MHLGSSRLVGRVGVHYRIRRRPLPPYPTIPYTTTPKTPGGSTAAEYLHNKKAASNPHRAVQQLVKAAEEEYNSSDNISAIYVHL